MGGLKVVIGELANGGFFVADDPLAGDHIWPSFAASTLDEALAYVRTRMAPPAKSDGARRIGIGVPSGLSGQVANLDAYNRAQLGDQGALSRQAMTGAVNRRNGNTWRV